MCFIAFRLLALNFEKQRAGLSMFRSAAPHECGTPTRGWMRRMMSDWKSAIRQARNLLRACSALGILQERDDLPGHLLMMDQVLFNNALLK